MPEFLEVGMISVALVLLLASLVMTTLFLADWHAGRHGSADVLPMFRDSGSSVAMSAIALLLYVGALAIVGGEVSWPAKQIGLVGLFVFWATNFAVGLYLALRSTEPFVTRDAPDGHFGQ
jgi:hypothetical protein